MNTFTKAYVPYGGYYSTPFCRWQGSMQNENSIELAGKTAGDGFSKKEDRSKHYRLPLFRDFHHTASPFLQSQLGSGF
jgi:hypothetical protein